MAQGHKHDSDIEMLTTTTTATASASAPPSRRTHSAHSIHSLLHGNGGDASPANASNNNKRRRRSSANTQTNTHTQNTSTVGVGTGVGRAVEVVDVDAEEDADDSELKVIAEDVDDSELKVIAKDVDVGVGEEDLEGEHGLEEEGQGEGEVEGDHEGEGEDEDEEDSEDDGDSEGSSSVGVEEVNEVHELVTGGEKKDTNKDVDGDVKMEDSETTDFKPIALPVLLSEKDLKEQDPATSASTANPGPTTTTTSSKPVSTKPKSKAATTKRSRSPSPTTLALLRPPPLQTVRLRITLGGPEKYEVDIAQMARDTGQRAPSPVSLAKKLEEESDEDSEEEDKPKPIPKPGPSTSASASGLGTGMGTGEAGAPAGPGEGGKPKKKKKKTQHKASDYYDVSDPFIDDSELALDDRKYFAQTKQAGFYVSSGEVALLKDKSPVKKPKSKKAPVPLPLTIHAHNNLSTPSSSHSTGAGAGGLSHPNTHPHSQSHGHNLTHVYPNSTPSSNSKHTPIHIPLSKANLTTLTTLTSSTSISTSIVKSKLKQVEGADGEGEPEPEPEGEGPEGEAETGPSSLVNVLNASASTHPQSYTYPPVPPRPSSSSHPPRSQSKSSSSRPPRSRSSRDPDQELGTKDSPIALYSDGEGDGEGSDHDHDRDTGTGTRAGTHTRTRSGSHPNSNSNFSTALKSPTTGSKKRTVLVQGSRASGSFPGSGPEEYLSAGQPPPTQQPQHSHSQMIYWRFSLETPLLGIGKDKVKQGVNADYASCRKLAWGEKPEMRFVLDGGTGGGDHDRENGDGEGEGGEGGVDAEVNGEGGEGQGEGEGEREGDGEGRKPGPVTGLEGIGEGVLIVGGAADKRKRYTTVVENGKKRKVVDISSFHPALHPLFDQLKSAIATENWETKGRFPQSIKPLLASVALTAIKLDEYDDHFFNLMPTLFPYNKFTMSVQMLALALQVPPSRRWLSSFLLFSLHFSHYLHADDPFLFLQKLIKRTVFSEHTAMIVERQDALLTQLKKEADEGFTKAAEEWERSVVAWDKRQKKAKANAALTANSGTPGAGGSGAESASNAPTRPASPMDDHDEDDDVVMQDAGAKSGGGAGKDPAKDGGGKDAGGGGKEKVEQPPAKKYRMTESMKAIVWELVVLSNEACRLENEKNTLEGSVMQVSEQGLRKVLYQKIVSCFPAGWMNSGQISRDVSAIKKKLEKELEEE
ncbi:hypothetical protein D9758_017651 [Tetrapyrgos nigripes]|uniref:Hpc2-related domain-containing protein n=1 Tax=Tetrapyrgos nigripes TaxID=182062 RepID=A0A8H5CGE7_9AGAR|nr:hypothetical protein D9758_017651 [Tetrapyrgos nigripes]